MTTFTPTLVTTHRLASDGYVLSLAQSDGSLAVATSENTITLLDRTTLKQTATFPKAHAARINEVSFAPTKTLVSGSSDGTVRLWDVSQTAPLNTLSDTSFKDDDEVWSVSAEGLYVAAGTNNAVVVWDVRQTARPLARYEMHTEAVTQVRFLPGSRHLVSGSVDELVCVLDTSQPEEDDAVRGVHNVQSPVAALGLYGASNDARAPPGGPLLAWVLSSTDVVQLWDLDAAERLAVYDGLVGHSAADHLAETEVGARDAAAASAVHLPVPVDFIAGCEWDARTRTLMMLGGDKSGGAHLFALPPTAVPPDRLTDRASQAAAAASSEAVTGDGSDDEVALPPAASVSGAIHHLCTLAPKAQASSMPDSMPGSGGGGGGAHDDSVRCFSFLSGGGGEAARASLITGGEDGRVAVWAWAQAVGSGQAEAEAGGASSGGGRKAAKESKEERKRAKPYDRPDDKKKRH